MLDAMSFHHGLIQLYYPSINLSNYLSSTLQSHNRGAAGDNFVLTQSGDITPELTGCEREAFYQIEGFDDEGIAAEQSGSMSCWAASWDNLLTLQSVKGENNHSTTLGIPQSKTFPCSNVNID